MSKRLWVAALMAGFLMAIPVGLIVQNLNLFAGRSWLAIDTSWGMIFLGMGMIGLGGLIAAPVPVRAYVSIART
jgi:hypothetical protein